MARYCRSCAAAGLRARLVASRRMRSSTPRPHSRLYVLSLLAALLLALPAFAQEAPGEPVPEPQGRRIVPFTDTDAPVRREKLEGISHEDREALEQLFEGHSAIPGDAISPDANLPKGYRPSVPSRGPVPAPAPDGEPTAGAPAPEHAAPEEEGEIVNPSQSQQPVTAPAPAAADTTPPAALTTETDEAAPPAMGRPVPTPDIYMDISRIATLRVLNKQTTRSRTVEVAENNQVSQGTLEVALEECWRSPPDARAESAALLRIWENKPDTGKTELFHGWIFSLNPSLNHLEHPVYDITLVECK